MTEIVSLRSYLSGLASGSSADRIIGTKTSGPRGVEAVLEYNGVFLNFREWIDTFIVTDIDGIDDSEISASWEPNPGDHGETPGSAFYRSRTIVISGKIETKTVWKLRDMQQGLRQAFVDISQERPLIFRTDDPQNDLMIYCKKHQKLVMPEKQEHSNEFKRSFQIPLRASNPRFLSVIRNFRTSDLGGAATFDDIAFIAVNSGNFPAQTLIEIVGPVNTGFTLVNELNDDALILTAPIPAGETWVIDNTTFPARMYRASDRADRFQYLSVNATDHLIEISGNTEDNPIRVIAGGLTSTSQVNMFYHHTVM